MENDTAAKTPVDVEFLRSIIENDFEFEKELFKIFLENGNRNIEKLEDSIKDSNDNFWYMAAHAFKGSAASVGAFELSKILEYAQKHPEESFDQKQELLNKIKAEFQLVAEFIAKELAGK